MLMHGDLWSWDGTASALKQVTNWGFQQDMSLSPDGKQVAYTSYPQVVADFIRREGDRMPANAFSDSGSMLGLIE